MIRFGNNLNFNDIEDVLRRIDSRSCEAIKKGEICESSRMAELRAKNTEDMIMHIYVSFSELINKGIMVQEFKELARSLVTNAYNSASQVVKYLAKEDACNLDLEYIFE